MRPTEEQEKAVEIFRERRPIKITAFAGAGKTSTLVLLAKSRRSRGLYLAFNKAIATEAKEKFPNTVDCRTTHSLAWRTVKGQIGSDSKLRDTLHPRQLAQIARYKPMDFGQGIGLTEIQQAYLVLQTIRRFCQSADAVIGPTHFPRYGRLLGANAATLATVRSWAISEADRLWARMISPHDDLPMGHDGYLKLWALGKPILDAEYILMDEAQDTNPVVLAVLQAQSSQLVYVGDRHQQIYEWRGAINAMEQVKGCAETSLTQSFRFGDAIASEASKVIKTLGEREHIRGNPSVSSAITDDAGVRVNTVLCRTNATVIVEVMQAVDSRLTPYIVGGKEDLKRLLSDVYELKKGNPGSCPEFFGFTDWSDVVVFAESEEGESIKTFVQLVEQHGEGKLWAVLKGVGDDENRADVILSTAHKAKGREWDRVRLSPDFAGSRQSSSEGESAAEVRLFYVAMTRAKKLLSIDPETLTHFTTMEWKNPVKKVVSAPRPAPAQRPAVRPQPAPATTPKVREIKPAIRTEWPPIVAPSKPKPPETKRSIWKWLFGG